MLSYTCIEHIDRNNLTKMLNSGMVKPETRSKLQRLEARVKKTGFHTVHFKKTDMSIRKKGVGRLYPAYDAQSLQNLERDVRKALCYQSYSDLDMVNAHPTILDQLFKKLNIECFRLTDYITNREQYLDDYMTATGGSRDDAKQEFISLMYGGKPKPTHTEFMRLFYLDFNKASHTLVNHALYNDYYKKALIDKPTNPLGQATSFIAQDIERIIMSQVINKLQEQGYETSTLIHDGVHIKSLDVRPDHIAECEDEVQTVTGYKIDLTVKSMEDFDESRLWYDNTDEEFERGDTSNARAFKAWCEAKGHRLVRCNKIVYWYHPDRGFYDTDLHDLRYLIAKCPEVDGKYRESASKKDALLKDMEIDTDNDFRENAYNSVYRKLAFKNGVYCFDTEKLLPFSHEYVFFFTAPIEFKVVKNPDVYQKLFVDIFGAEKAPFMLKELARSMAMERPDKLFLSVLGENNSGKGCMTDMLFNAFGRFVGNYNAGSLSSRSGSPEDQAKARSWLMFLRNCRIALTNEVKVNQKLCGKEIKLVSGDDYITARQNYINEETFKIQCTFWVFCNDMPNIEGCDQATTNRLKFIETEYSYLEGDNYNRLKSDPKVRKADPDLKNVFIKRKEIIQAFAYLVCKSYVKTAPLAPESVLKSNTEWSSEDDILTQIKNLFEKDDDGNILIDTSTDPGGKPVNTVTAKALMAQCKRNEIMVSTTRLGRIMTSIGIERLTTAKFTTYKNVKFYQDYTVGDY